MTADTETLLREARRFADLAMTDLRDNTGDSHHDYYTRAAANWIPDLAKYVHSLAAALEADEQEREHVARQLEGVHLALAEADVERAAGNDEPLWSEQHRVRLLASRAERAEAALKEAPVPDNISTDDYIRESVRWFHTIRTPLLNKLWAAALEPPEAVANSKATGATSGDSSALAGSPGDKLYVNRVVGWNEPRTDQAVHEVDEPSYDEKTGRWRIECSRGWCYETRGDPDDADLAGDAHKHEAGSPGDRE